MTLRGFLPSCVSLTATPNKQTRRDFLKSAGIVAGAAPFILPKAFGGESSAKKLNVACIGVGGQGSGIGHSAGQLGNVVACCDVDQSHADKFASSYKGRCATYHDYRRLLERKDIDVVTIGTPDHWHASIAIAALESGRDVYCEKPLTLTIDEGKQICKAVKRTKRVFQVGTQQRSDRKFLTAIALARNGRLGKHVSAICSIGGAPTGGPFPTNPVPSTLDWNMWLGQAAKIDYTTERCHGEFRWWIEYSGGKLTDWGAHHVDIAQWGLGMEQTGPIEVDGTGLFPNIPNDLDLTRFFEGKQRLANGYNTATEFNATLTFKNQSKIVVRDGPGNGIWFKGEKGEIFVSREKITGQIVEDLTDADQEWLVKERTKLYKNMPQRGHMRNFFDCVEARKEPVSDVFTHHRILTSCHLCNIAMLLKRKLRWDPRKEHFVGDALANALLSRPRRKGFELTA